VSDEELGFVPADWKIDLAEAKQDVERSGGALLPEQYDGALKGVAASPWKDCIFALYSLEALRNGLMLLDGMSEEGAEDFVCYNIVGVATEKEGPLFMVPVED
jgi:hypothetical protein